jgi:ABC-type multidrug transport system ATPase subunit
LNILAGRARSHGRISISADLRLDNFVVDTTKVSVRKHIAFVAQDDSLQVTATPREAIRFSAKLRLPRSTTELQLDKLTKRMLEELGLTSCADTYIGGALIKGISGGERKRTSVGVELVVKPALVFLDEPTSGLDSYSAVQLCQVLKKVANAGASVLFTIHQPASEIFNSFDHLILMNKGRVMYQGPVAGVPQYFADRGHPNPPNYNPADWIMNVAQSVDVEQLDKDGFFPKDDRDMAEPFTEEEGKDELGITITGHPAEEHWDTRRVTMLTEVRMLFQRELTNLMRDTVAVGSRFGLTIFLGILIGIIFLNVGETDRSEPSNVNSTFGALIVVLLMSMFGTAQPALLAFPEERPVFLREYSTNHYSVASYFLSRLTMEAVLTALQILVMVIITYFMIGFQTSFGLFFVIVYVLAMASTALAVMLGCAVEDPKLGQEMLPILFVPQVSLAFGFVFIWPIFQNGQLTDNNVSF